MFKSLKRSASVEADINLVRQLDNYDDLDQTTLETSEEQGPQLRGADGPWISPGENSDWLFLSGVFLHSFWMNFLITRFECSFSSLVLSELFNHSF